MFPAEKVMSMISGFGDPSRIPDFDPAELRTSGKSLVQAVKDGITADDAAAQTWQNELRRLFERGVDVFKVRNEFNAKADALKTGALNAAQAVEKLCDGLAEKIAPVIGNLAQDARNWTTRGQQVKEVLSQAKNLEYIPGWSGKAADKYSLAVKVQCSALTELHGIMQSTARGCDAGMMLNQGILFALNEAILETIETIGTSPTHSGDMYYLRTATSWQLCFTLAMEVSRATTGQTAAGAINALADECLSTIALPRVLAESQWPTGTDAAGTIPADTSSGVTHDGNADVETTVGGPSDTGVEF